MIMYAQYGILMLIFTKTSYIYFIILKQKKQLLFLVFVIRVSVIQREQSGQGGRDKQLTKSKKPPKPVQDVKLKQKEMV